MKRFAGFKALGAVTACVAVLSGCVGGTEEGVTLLGDSITVLASEVVTEQLDGVAPVRVAAEWGKRVDELLPGVEETAERNPEQAIVNLGTNDITQHRPTADILADYTKILDLLDGVECVHVISLNEHMLNDAGFSAAAAAFNEQLRTLVGNYDNVTLTEWSAIFAFPGDNGLMMDDMIHPNEEGSKKLGAVMAMMVQSCESAEDDS